MSNTDVGKSSKKLGMLLALLERLEKQRLPRLLALQEKMNNGEAISDVELAFLKEVAADAQRLEPMLDKHPQYQSLFIKLVGLYEDITARALDNK